MKILKAGGHNGAQMQRIRRRKVITGEGNLMGHVGQSDPRRVKMKQEVMEN